MNIQRRSIEDMSPKEIRLNLYVTQLIIIGVGLVLSYILFPNMNEFYDLWKWEPVSILIIGSGVACSIVLLDYIAMHVFPESWFDDGGINDRMFQGISVPRLLLITLVIGAAEEFLFRGVLQTHFGLIIASFIFAILHIRYVLKPFLFCFVCIISFVFGYVFQGTGNLFITIFAHFLVDFIMGLQLRK
ncbi:CPBP family intramembrane metalloprotease [Bacillus sp. DX1.1]|uniref:CPBP family intramembrane glutamic endopeptidase n=1 Tax=unclassified Bacillus (in: firmicutes) TaxID=185979 RepID=UPI0025701C08|nr:MULTISPECIES: CPBP family intramembrane glutamic endopeptidase [unclassified Bacillus (in: firmicutes)]MDM5154109.1 CPBP family intramembrane metalloprotease [Bacillus sp. DX1.1]WJE83035.1 CPBP family intramembrane metalloprotease [Bacillus sp. DX3.1]